MGYMTMHDLRYQYDLDFRDESLGTTITSIPQDSSRLPGL